MKYIRQSRAVVAAFLGISACAVCVVACSKRAGFDTPDQHFDQEAGVDSGECLVQCSLDGRSVIDSCTGRILTTCPDELACGAGLCQEPCAAAAADRSSNGCEFYFQPPFIHGQAHSCYAAYVVNTSTRPVDLSLEIAGKALDLSKSLFHTNPGEATLLPQTGPIEAGASAILFVSDLAPGSTGYNLIHCPEGVTPVTVDEFLPPTTGIGSSYHLKSKLPVSLAAIYPFGGAASWVPSSTLLLPVATWGTQNVIVNAAGAMTGAGWPGAQIVASEDATEVTVRPTRNIAKGPGVPGTAALSPITYQLNKGQVLQLVQSDELTGSIVQSTKPTSVFGGHECMFVPDARSYCDTALQQLPSFEQWGSEYVGVGYRPRLGDEHEPMPYRIVAARDGTRLDYDPVLPRGAPVTLSAGEVATFYAGTGEPFVVRTQDADHPIYLAAYMSGGAEGSPTDPIGNMDFLGNGDPEFVNVIPAGQYLNSYSFYADPTYNETSLVIVRAKGTGAQFKDVWLECAGNLTGFQPVGTRGEYEFVRVDLSRGAKAGQAFGSSVCQYGLQRMKSEGPFTATLWGWAAWASYAYPGGMAQRKLVTTPLPPVR